MASRMVHETNLVTLDVGINAPEGMVYSTSPRRAEGEDGYSYFVKGPDPEVAFAELAGCSFALEVGLFVPQVVVCTFEAAKYCGSRKVENSLRDVSAWLKDTKKIRNAAALYDVIVVDAWLANVDRNHGNVLGRPTHGSEIEVVMIDFEKSQALRPNPLIGSTIVEPRALWPSGDLGQVLKETKPVHPPQQIMDRISQVTQQRCLEVVEEVTNKLGDIPWAANSAEAVSRRAARISEIAEEVWRQN